MAGQKGMLKKHTIESVKTKVSDLTNGEYEVLSDAYPGYHTKMTFKHVACGNEYEISYNNFFQGTRCYTCTQKENGQKALVARKKGYDIGWAKNLVKVHGEGQYDLLSTEYTNVHEKVEILHKTCGKKYMVSVNHFRNGRRCTECKRVSTGEMHTELALKSLKIEYVKQKTFPDLKNSRLLKLDFWLPALGIAIEYDGEQHHRVDSKWYSPETVENDRIKNAYCEKKKIPMIRIPHTIQSVRSIATYIREKASTTIPQGSTLK